MSATYRIAQDGSGHPRWFAKSGMFMWTELPQRAREWKLRRAAERQLVNLRVRYPGARLVELAS